MPLLEPVLLPEPVVPEELGGLVEGFPLLESGVVLGGVVVLGEVVLLLPLVPELSVAELELLPELPVVADPELLLPEVDPGLLMLPLWPD